MPLHLTQGKDPVPDIDFSKYPMAEPFLFWGITSKSALYTYAEAATVLSIDDILKIHDSMRAYGDFCKKSAGSVIKGKSGKIYY